MARLIVVIAVLASLTFVGCGGGDDSSTTTPQPTALHWSRCPSSHYGAAVAGMSCREAYRHIPLVHGSVTGSAKMIRSSDPITFTKSGWSCTEFPLEGGSGWHVTCDQGDQHFAFYFTP